MNALLSGSRDVLVGGAVFKWLFIGNGWVAVAGRTAGASLDRFHGGRRRGGHVVRRMPEIPAGGAGRSAEEAPSADGGRVAALLAVLLRSRKVELGRNLAEQGLAAGCCGFGMGGFLWTPHS